MTGPELIHELRKFYGEGWKYDNRETYKFFFDKLHISKGEPVEFERETGREKMFVTYNDYNDYSVRYLL